MKMSVSLPDDDVEFLELYAKDKHLSKSAVIHQAIQALRMSGIEQDYAAAFDEFEGSGDAELWDAASGDGFVREAR